MEFHISRAIRKRLQLDDLLFSFSGNVVFGNVTASRKLARQMNEAREAEGRGAEVVNAGALFAMGLIDELSHAMVAKYRETLDPEVLSAALRWFGQRATPEQMDALLLAFSERFPGVAVYRGDLSAAEWLTQSSDGMTHREAAFEELMLLWLANANPAFAPFGELFDDRELEEKAAYREVTTELPEFFATRPKFSPEAGTLLDVLRAPMLAAPESLAAQLEIIRETWAPYLGEDLRRTLLAIDTLREEDIAIWMRFHPAGPSRHRHGEPGWGAEGFVGDEYVGFDDEDSAGGGRRRRGGRRYAANHQAPLNEYEAFSEDQAWMPNVVLMAKSTYVWLEQLSRRYGRHIHRLDQIPDEELRLMAKRGMTGLWLIGLWERSVASRTIKRLRGQSDAVASAYSLKDYRIAEDLGGTSAYEHLRDRAAAFGIRLASDMVPNHMGIDSNWVIQHPDWFISRPESPFPAYSFEGPDLSSDPQVEIKIEDHYFDQTDAAVVFRLRQQGSGETRFVYHGNDGTTFAWNDTAQLDYSKAYVREQVIQTILYVARLFPIIRFDAAMTLAKRHVQRLWFPLPGVGGSIPSRAESAMTNEEFDALMPNEFWREVVDRVAVEVPGTLLLAEAFWLLEGYFVRTLGMHRVYNSAFMNMLRDEENAKYRSYLKKTIEFDPDILKRYVNFMSNPDERTAIDQFGSGDKFFGTCTMLATLPGLPMFGHGQIEGYTERYGMEYKQARMEEWPNEGLIARHQQEIAPLLKRRHVFAESSHFVLYDFWTDHGTVDENVFAYSNRSGEERAIVLYNNAYASTRGTIHVSAASMDKMTGEMRQRRLSEALNLSHDDEIVIAYRDSVRNMEYLRRARDFDFNGLTVDLRGYQYMVLLEWRQLRSTAEHPWDRLCDALGGAGVYNLEESLSKLRLRPLHDALRQAITRERIDGFAGAAQALLQEESGSATAAGLSAGAAKRNGAATGTSGRSASGVSAGKTKAEPNGATGSGSPSPEQSAVISGFCSAGEWLREKILEVAPQALQAGSQVAAASEADGAKGSEARCKELAGEAFHLPQSAREFSPGWPAAVGGMFPNEHSGSRDENAWAPVLAWMLLRSLAPAGIGASLFDQLQVRSPLAEIFSSLGIESEEGWRAAARIRALLLQQDLQDAGTGETAFWSDPDVAWLTGLHIADGVRYLNKELFEQLLAWLQLPKLMAVAGGRSDRARAIAAIEADVQTRMAAAEACGYQLEKLLARWRPDAKDAAAPEPKAEPAKAGRKKAEPAEADVEGQPVTTTRP